MVNLFKMALRDLGRNRRRSFFSALALGMGLALLLTIASFINGEMRGSLDRSIKLESGHIQVRAKTYDENKTSLAWEDLVAEPDQMARQIAAVPLVEVATPRLFASGIVATGDVSAGVRVMGIDPASPANEPFRSGMVSGDFLTADDRTGILVGQRLADKMDLKTGDSLHLTVNTSNGDVDQQVFTIRGIFNTRTPGYDQSTIFMPISKAQAFAKAENHASTIFVLLKNIDDTDAVVGALRTSQYRVMSYLQMNELLIQTMQLTDTYMVLFYMIILGITATVIVNTLIMSVFERTREIGILSAIGMKAGRIMAMFFAESTLLAVGGVVLGLIIGGMMVYYFTTQGFYVGNMGLTGILMGERIYAYLTADDAVSVTVAAFIVALLAALYPAILAARLEPVQAMRGGKH